MSQDNGALIRAIYCAFAAGDVPGLLGRMSADIVWDHWCQLCARHVLAPRNVDGTIRLRC